MILGTNNGTENAWLRPPPLFWWGWGRKGLAVVEAGEVQNAKNASSRIKLTQMGSKPKLT